MVGQKLSSGRTGTGVCTCTLLRVPQFFMNCPWIILPWHFRIPLGIQTLKQKSARRAQKFLAKWLIVVKCPDIWHLEQNGVKRANRNLYENVGVRAARSQIGTNCDKLRRRMHSCQMLPGCYTSTPHHRAISKLPVQLGSENCTEIPTETTSEVKSMVKFTAWHRKCAQNRSCCSDCYRVVRNHLLLWFKKIRCKKIIFE